jgi:serine phosphatase RsbU (regulator of sigma subunit)/anti-sigma regulatory factor (Ser/Thr protein kinase)
MPQGQTWPHTTEERDAARLLLLQEITAALSEARDTSSVVDVICSTAREWLEADSALVFALAPGADSFTLIGAGGVDPALRERYREVPLSAPLPLRDAVRRRATVFLGSTEERVGRYPSLAPAPPGAPETVVVAPLLAQNRAVGAVSLTWRARREFPLAERAFLETVTVHCAQALERAQLYDAERRARREAEHNAERIRAQQELSARLSAVPGAAAVQRLVAEHVQRALRAQGVALLRYDDRTRRLTLLAGLDLPAALADGYRQVPLDAALPECDVIRTGRQVVVETRAERDLRYPLLGAGPGAGAAVAFALTPLVVESRPLGVLGVVWPADRPVSQEDRDLLAAVGNQCAQALDRAWLYDDAQRVARTLQESLVPPVPPEIPGLQVGVRYRPVGERTEVGGDFYDVFRITPGRWGVIIGDVSGKGVAAASLTALVRYTIRATAKRESSPAEVLSVLNEALLEDTAEEAFCTAVYLEIEPSAGSAQVSLAVAGHPLPRLLTPDGKTRELGEPGMALGLLPMPAVHNAVFELGPGELMALYTDGVAEARAPGGGFAGELVAEVLHSAAGLDAQRVADRLERTALEFQEGEPRDDLAVVTLRVPLPGDAVAGPISAAMSMTLPCAPESAGLARRAAREFLREHDLEHLADVVQLLTSEIVTNAVVHAGTPVGLRMSAIGDRLRVEARDASRARPVRRDLDLEALDGRGLLLLDRMSTAWDVRRTAEGKTVWFELDLAPR